MITTYLNTLREAYARRAALALAGMVFLIGFGFNMLISFGTSPKGEPVMLVGGNVIGSPAKQVPIALSQVLNSVSGLWLLVSIFAAVPLLSSTLERGWLELLFSKGTPRWQIMLGRYFAGVTIYAMAFMIATFPLAIRLWWHTGVATNHIVYSLLLDTFSFASILAVGVPASLAVRNAALPTLLCVMTWILSSVLEKREAMYGLFNSAHTRTVLDWTYRILPKNAELGNYSSSILLRPGMEWNLVWTTGIFTVVVMSLTLWWLERKSF